MSSKWGDDSPVMQKRGGDMGDTSGTSLWGNKGNSGMNSMQGNYNAFITFCLLFLLYLVDTVKHACTEHFAGFVFVPYNRLFLITVVIFVYTV